MNGREVSRTEWLLMSGVVLAWGLAAVAIGKDTGWDFRNYHWYDAYALLHGRMGFDLAVAHHATYYNPLIHVPFYLIATDGNSWLALFYLGLLQGLTVIPLYVMSRSALSAGARPWMPALLAIAGTLGSTAITMTGKTSYDQSLLSALVLSALAVLIVGRESLAKLSAATWRVTALAGFIVGSAVGLKLVTAPYGFGIAVVLMMLPGAAALRSARVAGGAAGAVLGVALTGGFWFLALQRATGNPIFPYFNHFIGSPLVGSGSFVDQRFIPGSLWEAISFPIRFTFDYHLADDGAFRDLRVPLMYLLVPSAALLWWLGRRASEPLVNLASARILFLFAGASYLAWLPIFAIYRYLLPLELLGPLVIMAAIGLMPLAANIRLLLTAALLLLSAATARYELGGRVALGDPYVQVRGLSFPNPTATLLLMTGHEPMAYLIPSLPPQIAALRIDGWLANPGDGSVLTAMMRARVAAFQGDLFLLASPDELEVARQATAAYGLRIIEAGCNPVTTNLEDAYRLCPLRRLTSS